MYWVQSTFTFCHQDPVCETGLHYGYCLFSGPELWTDVCKVLNGKRVALKSHITPDGFRTPNVQLVWGELTWVDCVDNGIRYGLLLGY
jgi:hypothetical protein